MDAAAARIDALEQKYKKDIAALRKSVLNCDESIRRTADNEYVSVYDYIQVRRPAWNRLRVRRETTAVLQVKRFRVFYMHVKGGTKPTLCADDETASSIYKNMLSREESRVLSRSLDKEPEIASETQTHSMLCSCLLCN